MDIEDVLPPQSQVFIYHSSDLARYNIADDMQTKLNSIRKQRLEKGDHVTLQTISSDEGAEESITNTILRAIKFW